VHDIDSAGAVRYDTGDDGDDGAADESSISEEDGEAEKSPSEHVVIEGQDGRE